MADELRLKVAIPVKLELIKGVSGPRPEIACEKIWQEIWTSINKTCAEIDRVPIEDSIALVWEIEHEVMANCPNGYHPCVVTVQTTPAIVAA